MDISQIMVRAMDGDRAAFRTIVDIYGGRMSRFAVRLVGDKDMAADIVQDAFVNLWQSRASYRPKASVEAYLFRVVRNACVDTLRSSRTSAVVAVDENCPSTGSSPETAAAATLFSNELVRALQTLPESQRLVFVLSEQEGLTYAEIAEVLGCPHGTVASRKSAAIEALRIRLAEWL